MNDYIKTCNQMACSAKAERKVWRWAEYRSVGIRSVVIALWREDSAQFHICDPAREFTRTEYDGDAQGNPIAAAQPGELSAQELLEMGFGFVGYKGGEYDLFVNWEQPCISGTLPEVLAAARKMAGGAA